MTILKKFFVEDHDDPDRLNVWEKLRQLEQAQQELELRLAQVELRSGIYKRQLPGGAK